MARHVTVYRIENKEKLGPYVYCSTNWQTRSHSNNPNTPSPWDEGINISNGRVCGFSSMGKLRQWFSVKRELLNLHNQGFFVGIYKINPKNIQIGKKQIVFKPKKSKPIRKVSLKRVLTAKQYARNTR